MSVISVNSTTYGPSYPGYPTHYQWVDIKRGNKQVPFTGNRLIALPYQRTLRVNVKMTTYNGETVIGANYFPWGFSHHFNDGSAKDVGALSRAGKLAYNRAYTKLLTKLHGEAADILTLIRERKLIADMIYNRTHQVADLLDEIRSYTSARGNTSKRAARHRKGALSRIAAILATTPAGVRQKTATLRRREGLLTTPAELILELRWGWGPLVSDINSALTGLAEPIPYLPISGSAGYPIDHTSERSDRGDWMHQVSKGHFKVKVGGLVAIDNSLTAAFERVGMTNILQSLYETVPYSWLVDYFSSLGDVISSLDDSLVGKLTSPYFVFFAKGKDVYSYKWNRGYPNERGRTLVRENVEMIRHAPSSLPLPALVVHAPDLSPWRIATAASLVVLKVKKFKALGL